VIRRADGLCLVRLSDPILAHLFPLGFPLPFQLFPLILGLLFFVFLTFIHAIVVGLVCHGLLTPSSPLASERRVDLSNNLAIENETHEVELELEAGVIQHLTSNSGSLHILSMIP
jgi:hypothetical protein